MSMQLYNKSCQLATFPFLWQTDLFHLGNKIDVDRPISTIATNSASSYLERMLRLARQGGGQWIAFHIDGYILLSVTRLANEWVPWAQAGLDEMLFNPCISSL